MNEEENNSLKKADSSSLIDIQNKTKRDAWENKTETFLSALGAIIGLGNIWRFPYITYQYGGGAFLIPYVIFVICCGYPMFFFEISIGQFTQKGAIEAWNIAPLMKGVGIGSAVLAVYFSVSYIIVMAWSLNYFFHTFRTTELPWMKCDQWFNTNSCRTYQQLSGSNMTNNLFGKENLTLPIIEFWNNYVLRKHVGGVDSIGYLDNWPMVGCMLVSWIMIYFCIWRGTKSSGKVIYFTTIFPFLILIILIVRGCTLPGAIEGIKFYLQPNVSQLARAEVWVQAGTQVCYSYAICFAILIAFGSYSEFNSNCYKRAFYLTLSCSTTSFIGGFAVFSVLGNMAEVLHVPVKDVVKSGPGLAFLTYPTALSMMPAPQFWNASFFFMLLLLAIDSQFATLEGIICLFMDSYKWPRGNRQLFSALMCSAFFLLGLLFITPSGVYIFEIFNNYAVGGIALLWLVTWQSVGVGWVYGARRYYDIIEKMIGYYPSIYMNICFRFLTPALTMFVLFFYVINYEPMTFDGYVYPRWANVFGWLLCLSSFLCVPGWAFYEVYCSRGATLKQKYQRACKSKIAVPVEENETKAYTKEDKEEEATYLQSSV